MVTTRTIRSVSRRMLLAFLASAGVAGLSVEPAAAQSGTSMKTRGVPASGFGLSDLQLAPGETIVGSPTTMGGPVINHNGGSYQIVDSSSVPMAADLMNDSIVSEVPLLHSSSVGGCGNASCGGNCGNSSCGGASSASRFHGNSGLGMGGNVCGATCNPYLYASVDALYMYNNSADENGRASYSVIDDFDYEFGGRGTFGMVPDCRNGFELSFVAPLEWDTSSQATVSGADVRSLLFPTTVLGPVDLADLTSVTELTQYSAEYLSVEISRTLIGWEICKFLYGARYVGYDEDFLGSAALTSIGGSTNPTQTRAQASTQNQLFGLQVGGELTYPLTCKIWSDFRGRAGAYANFAENQVQTTRNGTLFSRSFDDTTQLAGLFEIGGGVRYYVTDDFHLRAGGELWYLAGIATAGGQLNERALTSRGLQNEDDVLMIGVTVGGELKF